MRSKSAVKTQVGTFDKTWAMKGIVFLDNGGYTLQHKIYKRKQRIEKISDYVNFLVKPLGIITMILTITFTTIKILEFYGIIQKCVCQ